MPPRGKKKTKRAAAKRSSSRGKTKSSASGSRKIRRDSSKNLATGFYSSSGRPDYDNISFCHVPETKPVDDLMREMQQEGAHIVIVVDEYGNTAGLASMEDLVEVILGEIRDEHEPGSDVTDDGNGGYIVSGSFDLSRIADLLDFRPEEAVSSTTVGGLVMEWLGRVPKPGEFVERKSLLGRSEVALAVAIAALGA